MLKRSSLMALLVTLGLIGQAAPARAQALLPYVLPIDYDQLEQQGLILAQEAAQLAQFRQFRPALARAQLAVQLVPNDAEVWGLLGSLYLESEDTEKALEALNRANSLQPNDPPVLFALGTAYFRQNQYLQAASYLEAGLRIEPNTPGALFDLANTYYKLNRLDQAITRYQDSVNLSADFWPSINNIGLVLYEQGDADGAIKHWQQALEVAGEEPEPQLAIAVATYVSGDRAQGIELGIAALERDSRYADIDFLRDNLWGTRLIADTEKFFNAPAMRIAISQL